MKTSVARWLSIAFHPFVMVAVMVGVAAAERQTTGEAVRSVSTVALLTIVPLAVLMWRQVHRGRWENVDASNLAERPILFVVGGAGIAALLVYVLVIPQQSFMVRGVGASLGLIALSAFATRWVKVSLHMAFGALAATALAIGRSPIGYALLLSLPVLLWSRLVLKRHPPLEVALGTIIGAGAGAAMHYL